MSERKILLLVLFVAVYCFYSMHVWLENIEEDKKIERDNIILEPVDLEINETVKTNEIIKKPKKVSKNKSIPLHFKNACSILQIFTEKPLHNLKKKIVFMDDHDRNTLTSIAISMFLLVLIINAIIDVLKVKEEERLQTKLNPDGIRRQSLSEFANKRPIRRESSKFGMQLFQIAEANSNSEEERPRRPVPYSRADSINSYLSEKKLQNETKPLASMSEGSGSEPKLVKRQSVAKLFGDPTPMVRRCSFPALPINPEVQALMFGHSRQASVDSDDEDGRGKRVRLIRRF